ncbi:glutamine-hydrolyzing carbamoyl-phosphate synthase small subunit [Bacillaceae bacterium SIJ1]|uniref:carbamoyl phosphate synthase small subunit n=1 Tax=Litoribacterium kuwaitense TaxID=1398745 RepID=UPI0013EC004B|nr:carbamoyl phosphate synthase small subunit [Litoribacterium kuwaitense]NGP44317.1 glutamine-hydrolyzing carbamoyl-phosphate synthase small subunit [Litoribacterium kuwaitense]
MKKQLVLEDGSVFVGEAFGATTDVNGEVVFNTGMTGYQEILSDPSYCGQIVTLTYPLIGNYGINRDDFESISPSLGALIVKEHAVFPSNWRSEEPIHQFLESKGIPGLSGIDTRRLTRQIREHGTLKGKICSIEEDANQVAASLAKDVFPINQVAQVSTRSPYSAPGRGDRVVLIDYGMKHGILRELTARGCDVVVVPYNTTYEEVLQLHPDGVMLSNGPGNPQNVPEAVATIKGLIGKVPLFGICLGHQLFALAAGAETVKMKFGHRGSNHPVQELATGRVDITSQNHGYTVAEESLEGLDIVVTHRALNDGTVEGLEHRTAPAFSVQYHPEASPGPEDSNHLFHKFMKMIQMQKEGLVHAKA